MLDDYVGYREHFRLELQGYQKVSEISPYLTRVFENPEQFESPTNI